MDYQFGPVILLGMGGTGVEIYGDTTLRMAPFSEADVVSMVRALRAHQLLEGYRGSEPISLNRLTETLLAFSNLAMELQDRFESIDLNPVICSPDRCVVADARIMLVTNPPPLFLVVNPSALIPGTEEIMFEDVSTGAHNNLAKATDIARSMVKEYGLSSKVGQVYFA